MQIEITMRAKISMKVDAVIWAKQITMNIIWQVEAVKEKKQTKQTRLVGYQSKCFRDSRPWPPLFFFSF